jgi:hypothetical protein
MTTKSMMVRVGADTRDMERGLSSAQKRIKAFRTSINQIGKRMMVAGAAVVGAVGLIVKNYAKAGDEVHKMALRTGFATETLSELRYASQICGADLGALEKGVKRMSKTINDATKAGGAMATYVRAFDQIGLEAEELIKLSPEEQFDKIARAIARVENPTIRAARAQDIFGRAGTQLLPLFAAGEEGLEALRKKAHELGIVFDQEAANRAAKFTDAMTTLKGAFQGMGIAIADKFAPILTSLAEHFTDVFVNIRGNTQSFVKSILGFFKVLAMGVQGLMLAWTGMKGVVFKVAEYAGIVMKKQIDILTAPLKLLAKIPGAFGEPARLMLKEVAKLTGTLTIITDGYNKEADKQVEAAADIIEKYETLVKMLDKTGDTLDGLKTKTKETTKAATEDFGTLPGSMDLGPAVKMVGMSMEEVERQFKERLDAMRAAQAAWFAELYSGARNVVGGLDAVFGQFHENQARRIENEEKQQTDAIESWYERERERLETTIMNEEAKVAALEALDEEKARKENKLQHEMDKKRRKLERSRAKSQKVTAMFAAGINVAEAITKALTAGPIIGQILAGIVAGLGAVQIAAIAAAPLPALQKGGRIEKAAIVGERGPELFVPDRAGTIIPLQKGIGLGAFYFSPIVNIYAKTLDDYTINHSAEKIFAAMERERRRRGY